MSRNNRAAGVQRVGLLWSGVEIGRMLFQVCHQCRRGLIGKVSINPEWQGCGVGTRAVRYAHAQAPDYTWRTTAQYATAGTFWPRMARLTGTAFTDGADAFCPHMRHAQRPGTATRTGQPSG